MRSGFPVVGAVVAVVAMSVLVGGRLLAALAQIGSLGAGLGGAGNSVAPDVASAVPGVQSPSPSFPTSSSLPASRSLPAAPPPGAGEALPEMPTADAPSPFSDAELMLEYIGDRVSLNDFGQLQTADPEFERAIRELAGEQGEIEPGN